MKTGTRKFSEKDIKKLCFGIGGFYVVFGVFGLLISWLQSFMLSQMPPPDDENFTGLMNETHDIFYHYLPFMILIGAGYLLFGLYFEKTGNRKFQINLILSIISLLFVVGYTLRNLEFLHHYFNQTSVLIPMDQTVPYIFAVSGLVVLIAMFTFPQFIIGWKIRQGRGS